MSDPEIRQATMFDLNAIKELADAHRHELGFVRRPALARSIERGELFVAQNGQGVIGFVEYHHRRDGQTTLYHLAVQADYRRQGLGRRLVQALVHDAGQHSQEFIQLKCPVDLEANRFYQQIGFAQIDLQRGKRRDLAIWRLSLAPGCDPAQETFSL
ncbi:MAG TPA: N-acetyltransferase [Anaerolineae bacterium]|nr:N-acetyltransferase [Anaerolineae bacterium]